MRLFTSCSIELIRILFSIVVTPSWPLFQLDVKNALYDDLKEDVYMEQPPGYVAQGGRKYVISERQYMDSIRVHGHGSRSLASPSLTLVFISVKSLFFFVRCKKVGLVIQIVYVDITNCK